LWHSISRADVERLVAGRERIYLDVSGMTVRHPKPSTGDAPALCALYALPGAMHCAFNQFAAFAQDAVDNKAFLAARKLKTPVLAIGRESFGSAQADVMRFVADDVTRGSGLGTGHVVGDETHERRLRAAEGFPAPIARTASWSFPWQPGRLVVDASCAKAANW